MICKLVAQQSKEETMFWGIIVGVVVVVVLLIALPTMCVKRCFYPEQSRGPSFEVDENGYERWVNPLFHKNGFLSYPSKGMEQQVNVEDEKKRLGLPWKKEMDP